MERSTVAPIDRLRRIVAHTEAGQPLQPDDAAWLAAGARVYMETAPTVRLDAALGLHPQWGEAGWWIAGPRAERDALLAQMDQQLFGDLDISAAARSIVALARRRQECADVHAAAAPLLDQLAATGRSVPGQRQLMNILRRSRAPAERKSDTRSNFPA
jgi:hypothetical protein